MLVKHRITVALIVSITSFTLSIAALVAAVARLMS